MDSYYYHGVPLKQEDVQQQGNVRYLDFWSYVSSYPDRTAVLELLQVALAHHGKFNKETSPWDKPDLTKIALNMNRIDRVYHLRYYEDNNYNVNLEVCFRQDIAGRKLFVEMIASYNGNDDDEFVGDGDIYMTMYPAFFLNNSKSIEHNKEEIRSALASDGYRVSPEETHEYMQGNPSYGNTVPNLQFLTHTTIYNHRNKLNHVRKRLPRSLSVCSDEFIQIKEKYDIKF